MPSKRIAQCFIDILSAIDLIETWTNQAGGVEKAIFENLLVRSGIERQLLMISEAAIRLGKLDPSMKIAPGIDWPGVRGIGNFIRHKYDDLDGAVIADVLRNRLGPLKSVARQALSQIGDEI